MFCSIILSNMSFLAIRMCVKHRLYPEDFSSVKQRDPQRETVEALSKLVVSYVNFACPTFVTLLLLITPWGAPTENVTLKEQFYMMMVIGGI